MPYYLPDWMVVRGATSRPEEYTGTWCMWYDEGNIRSVVNYSSGKMNGSAEGWYENGNKSYEFIYVDDVHVGRQVNYHMSGPKYTEVEYAPDGSLLSETRWNEDGTIKSRR